MKTDLLQASLVDATDPDRCDLTLALVRDRLVELERLFRRPIAWLALELLAHVLKLEPTGVEYRRLVLAEALLEAARAFYHPRRANAGALPVHLQLAELELAAAGDQVDQVDAGVLLELEPPRRFYACVRSNWVCECTARGYSSPRCVS